MTIELRCSCGNLLRAKDEWVGRRAKCPKCGAALTIPGPAAAPLPGSGGLDDLLSEDISPQLDAPADQPLPRPPASRPPKSKRGWFGWLFWKFPGFGSSLRWREPTWYRVRLRGDALRRFAVVLAVWAAGTGGFLVLFAVNNNPPGIPLGIVPGAIFAGIAAIAVFFRRNLVSGSVSVDKDHIFRSRDYASMTTRGTWTEWSKWPYETIERCVIVPAEALGKSFSVMLIGLGSKREMIAIPQSVDLERVRRHIAAMGVPVDYGRSVPAEYTEPMSLKVPAVTGVVGAACFLMGLGFYADKVGGFHPPQANARNAGDGEDADAKRERREEIAEKVRGGLDQGFRGDGPIVPTGMKPPSHDERSGQATGSPPPEPAASGQGSAAPGGAVPGMPGGRRRDGRDELPFGGFRAGEPDAEMPPAGMPPFGVLPQADPSEASPPSNPPRTPASTGSPHRPAAPAAKLEPGDTELVGGSGGWPFRTVSPSGKPVIGFRYAIGRWRERTAAPRRLDPLYDRDEVAASDQTVLAREGYAVGAINVDVGESVNAVQVVFMRATPDGRLDKTDLYTSDWIGQPSGSPAKTLGGTGAKVLGVHGRRGALIEAVGLVMEGP
jgi:hypothetical protein